MPDKKTLPDMIIAHHKLLSDSIFKEIDNITGKKPIGSVAISTKEQLERWRSMTPQDRMSLLQQVGADKYIEWEMEMEKKDERSANAFNRHYGIMED